MLLTVFHTLVKKGRINKYQGIFSVQIQMQLQPTDFNIKM